MKKLSSLLLSIAILLSALPVSALGADHEPVTPKNQQTYENIGIGGGGSMFTPMIDPSNPNRFYATCDMGGLYYSYDRGTTWNRTESYGWLKNACIADDGTVFAGGYGLYASTDHGQTLEMIYPKNVQYQVSRCGWSEKLMLAKDFNNGYLCAVAAGSSKVYFATTDWDGNFMLMKSDFNGNNLQVLYRETLNVSDPNQVEIVMTTRGDDLYYTFQNTLWKYDSSSNIIYWLYGGEGNLVEVEWVDDQLFLLDDTPNATKILYTRDLVNWSDLSQQNTLPNTYEKWGSSYCFDWHFKEVSGNNFENLYLSFSHDSEDGIMKFNGTGFEWVFDSMYKTRSTIQDEGWSYGCHGPFYGLYADPSDDDFFLVSNTETVYTVHYGDENDRSVHTTHCVAQPDGTYTSAGFNVQTTYSVKEDPFNPDHIIICTTDMGLQNSYNNGKSFRRMEITGGNWNIFNTCYDLYFDPNTQDLVYGLWSSRHDAPYNPQPSDRDWTEGAFAVSRDGGTTWDFSYSSGLPADCIPVKMSVQENGDALTIAVATFNRGFYISYDSGKTFTSISDGMERVDGLIWGEDIVMTEDTIYCLTAPYNCFTGKWQAASLYAYDLQSGNTQPIDLGDLVLVRSLTYHPEQGLYLNVIPSFHYEWFPEFNNGLWVNDNGGIYHYDGNSLSCVFANNNGIFHSAFAADGTLYATEPYGKVYAGKDGEFSLFAEGLFNQLKNISFSSDGHTMYVTTFGGGTYRMGISAPEAECVHSVQLLNAKAPTCSQDGYTGDNCCTICGQLLSSGQLIPATGHTPKLINNKAPTCSQDGYTGDSSCTTCGQLLSSGQLIPATGHTPQWTSNEDGTHLQSCTTCSAQLLREDCADRNGDSRCDTCGYTLAVQVTYSKRTSMTTGKRYLITMSNKAMQKNLSAAAVTVTGYGTYTVAQSEDLTHWTYESGKIWCEENGVRYYLYVNSSNRLALTTNAASAATWTVSKGRISTAVRTSSKNNRTTTYYLGISGSSFAATTRKSTAVLYEMNL